MLNPESPLESLLAPGLRLMQAVRLPVKFAIVAAALLVPMCVAVYGVVDYAQRCSVPPNRGQIRPKNPS
ncbi:MAG: hypothetical protein ACREXP_31905 [Steroidobacteraceae bacterium]